MSGFEFATATRVVAGAGTRDRVAPAVALLGARPLVVTGADTGRAGWLLDRLESEAVGASVFSVEKEPTLEDARAGVTAAREHDCDVVVGCGGGAALDAAKAIAAVLGNGGDPLDYVEVVGRGVEITSPSLPLVAVPTTAGTGSEVTKNSVLGVPEKRVKVSMRSDLMLPRLAVVDPELTHSTPAAVTASTGLDALTHLIEAYVSHAANPLTDAICRQGILAAAGTLQRAFRDGGDAPAREGMSCASLFGGLALANAKLGAVHGFAGPAGGMFDAPHGCLCGRLLPSVIETNVRALQTRRPDAPALARYGEIAAWLTSRADATAGDAVDWIQGVCDELAVPSLSHYGVTEEDVDDLVQRARRASSMRGNPIELSNDELRQVVRRAI